MFKGKYSLYRKRDGIVRPIAMGRLEIVEREDDNVTYLPDHDADLLSTFGDIVYIEGQYATII